MSNTSNHRILLSNDVYLKDIDSIKTIFMDGYVSGGGYKALSKALKSKREDIIEEVKKSGLRGRGGAGFSAGQKWEYVAGAEGQEKYLCCNASEGEPGTYKDRCLIRSNPHQLIEGAIIAAYAVGANKSIIYINENNKGEAAILEKALKEAKEKGYIGKKIANSDFSLDMEIKRCPDKYIAGEETAMIEVIEGRAPKPWQKPPHYPAVKGLFGKPTLINNAETLSNIPHIVLKGADWFAKVGSRNSPGTMLFSVSGDVEKPGVFEAPLGTTIREIINSRSGGVKNGMKIKAVFPAGPSNSPLTESQLNTPLDFDSLKEAGSGLGSAAITVVGDKTCIVNKAVGFSRFFMEESCGQCPACQMGTVKMYRLLKKIEDGNAEGKDAAELENICSLLEKEKVYCRLLRGAVLSVKGTIGHFRDDFNAHINNKKCPLQ